MFTVDLIYDRNIAWEKFFLGLAVDNLKTKSEAVPAIDSSVARVRLGYLDFLRGIASMLVVIEHSCERLDSRAFDNFVSNWVSFGQLGVLIFFILSGYIIPYSYESVKGHLGAFWISRVFRLYPLYIFVIGLTMITELYIYHVHVDHLYLSLFAHVIFVQQWVGLYNFGGPSWTLFLELLWYVGFTIICMLSLKRRFGPFFYLIVGMYLAIDIAALFINIHLPLGRVAYLYSFFVGYLCYLYRNEKLITGKELSIYLSVLLFVIYFALFIGFGLHPKPYLQDFYFSLTDVVLNWSLGLGIFAFVFFLPHLKYPAFLLYIGRISYSIYMIHPLVLEISSHFSINRWIYVPLVVLISIGISHFTYRYIERPFINFGRSINNILTSRSHLACR